MAGVQRREFTDPSKVWAGRAVDRKPYAAIIGRVQHRRPRNRRSLKSVLGGFGGQQVANDPQFRTVAMATREHNVCSVGRKAGTYPVGELPWFLLLLGCENSSFALTPF